MPSSAPAGTGGAVTAGCGKRAAPRARSLAAREPARSDASRRSRRGPRPRQRRPSTPGTCVGRCGRFGVAGCRIRRIRRQRHGRGHRAAPSPAPRRCHAGAEAVDQQPQRDRGRRRRPAAEGIQSSAPASARVIAARMPTPPNAAMTTRPQGGRRSSSSPAPAATTMRTMRDPDEQRDLVVRAEEGDRGILRPRRCEIDEGRADRGERARARRDERGGKLAEPGTETTADAATRRSRRRCGGLSIRRDHG